VAQGAAETLTATVSELSLKDSTKSDSTGGDRLFDDSVQSDGVTPKSSLDCANSGDNNAKPSFLGQQSFDDRSQDKTEVVSAKTTSVDSDAPFNVITLLHSGQTLRYFVCFH